MPGLVYAVSKAAVNLMARKLHFEHEGVDFGGDSSWMGTDGNGTICSGGLGSE